MRQIQRKEDIDAIEIDENLRHILKGKGIRVVHDDFLTYQTHKRYNLIVMNPPFSNGDKHLLKALSMQENGGQVVCLLNAQTLKNPYTVSRKDLVRKLSELNAKIEYCSGAFEEAERETSVEIAIIKVDIPIKKHTSILLEHLEKSIPHKEQNYESTAITHADFLRDMIARYELEVSIGVNLINEYNALKPYILNEMRDNAYSSPILDLKMHCGDEAQTHGYIRAIRLKYWNALFQSPEFTSRLTSNLVEDLRSRVKELQDYEFSISNILSLQVELSKETIKGIEETIVSLFDELSDKHHYYDTNSKNIHYFNGWKTNKAWKINKKVIIPLSAWDWGKYVPDFYRTMKKLNDIEVALDFLDCGNAPPIDLKEQLSFAKQSRQTKNIELKHFSVTFFKKGTCHITFADADLLAKLNLFGCQRKGWLPPTYGKWEYDDMEPESQAVIDEYEGKEAYARVMKCPEKFIIPTNNFLAIGAAHM